MTQSRVATFILVLSVALMVQGVTPFLGQLFCGTAWTAPYGPSETKNNFYLGLIFWGFMLFLLYSGIVYFSESNE